MLRKTGISEKLIPEWVNLAGLFRIKGVGEEYSDFLEEAGVDTVVELSIKRRNFVRKLSTIEQVKNWIEQAKKLPRKVEY